jgi:hypothetical protein
MCGVVADSSPGLSVVDEGTGRATQHTGVCIAQRPVARSGSRCSIGAGLRIPRNARSIAFQTLDDVPVRASAEPLCRQPHRALGLEALRSLLEVSAFCQVLGECGSLPVKVGGFLGGAGRVPVGVRGRRALGAG